jgi:uncharacterized protein YndB with AHSA1/START domain
VHVHSARRYRFDAGPEELWAAFTKVEDYRHWWPWLRRFDAGAFAEGERWTCVVQPPLPYSLRFDLVLDEVVEGERVAATVTGDITGSARLELTADGTGSELALESKLAPANAMLRAIAVVARPVVRFGHDWVLDTGLRQFKSSAL